jgi:quinol monooxygenase YgiN
MSVVVVARLVPASGHHAEVVQILEESIPKTHVEDEGCLLYALHEGDGDALVFIEKWESEGALQGHLSGPGAAALVDRLDGLLQGPIQAEVLRPHPAGSTKGEL